MNKTDSEILAANLTQFFRGVCVFIVTTPLVWAVDIYFFRCLWSWIITKKFNIPVPDVWLVASIMMMIYYVKYSFTSVSLDTKFDEAITKDIIGVIIKLIAVGVGFFLSMLI